MAFRDRFDKIISYFDTDNMGDEEAVSLSASESQKQAIEDVVPVHETIERFPNRPSAPKTKPVHQRSVSSRLDPSDLQSSDSATYPLPINNKEGVRQDNPHFPERPHAPSSPPKQQGFPSPTKEDLPGQTQIAIKHPLRYEDASAIADAFLAGQCILVDFEFMQDAQARRCIDFLTGACLVAQGTLQKVGATMFLLTPKGVVVVMEEVLPQQTGQEAAYDYDMKRR